ncbi:MAG: A/G-specific adenine glycosylase [Ruminococcaceae bacterium]|nr:A/G-specific adenine glycosylase [Oscillospiraceae bacterium]
MSKDILKNLPGALLPWFAHAKRDLPWRQDKQPYHVWLSEIMLQQTRVEAVKSYYTRFLSALPTVADLAAADDELLHKLWEGLGYYSRVRNLKKAAQVIMDVHGGNFPQSYDEIRALPGIGTYTAGAIASICYDLPTPAVDGNVLRVISRICNDNTPIDSNSYKTDVQQRLAEVYPGCAGDFTQALMELGATVCGPNRAPQCEACPCRDFCLGHICGTAEQLPVKTPKKAKKQEERTVFVLSCGDFYALKKRPDTGLLAGLWEFPNVPGCLDMDAGMEAVKTWDLRPRQPLRQVERQHIFTHIRWQMRGLYLEVSEKGGDLQWFTAEEIRRQTALPTAFRQFWEEIDHV